MRPWGKCSQEASRWDRNTYNLLKEIHMREKWKDIPGYAGYFCVSNLGRIWSYPRLVRSGKSSQRLVQSSYTRARKVGPYLLVRLTHGTTASRKVFTIHKLVMLAFCGSRPLGMEICHLDGDSHNNHLNNLAYVTHLANERQKEVHGTRLHGAKHPSSKLTEAQVSEIIHRHNLGEGVGSISRLLNTNTGTVSNIISGRSWRRFTGRTRMPAWSLF